MPDQVEHGRSDTAAVTERQALKHKTQGQATARATNLAKVLQSGTDTVLAPVDDSNNVEASDLKSTPGSHSSGSRFTDSGSYSTSSRSVTSQEVGSKRSPGANLPRDDAEVLEGSQLSEAESDWFEDRYMADVARVPPKRTRKPVNYYVEDKL